MYNTQPEDVKQNIIAAVLELGTGNAVDFLKNAYEEADNWSTKRSILKALYGYNEAGRQMFNVRRPRQMLTQLFYLPILRTY